jgi:hypothetical protein
MRWYRSAADLGDAAAMTILGNFYDSGLDVPTDYAEAMGWYRKAADLNDAVAMNNIGNFFQFGLGVPTDYGEAQRWYQMAAERGNADAKMALESRSGSGVFTTA